jgi:hypothetical protein
VTIASHQSAFNAPAQTAKANRKTRRALSFESARSHLSVQLRVL